MVSQFQSTFCPKAQSRARPLLVAPFQNLPAADVEAKLSYDFTKKNSFVVKASNQRALETITTATPDVIVATLDSQMRNDRLSWCRAIWTDARTRGIPIVLTTPGVTPDVLRLPRILVSWCWP